MIDLASNRISDDQAEAVATAICRLMQVDLALRSTDPSPEVSVNAVSGAIIQLVYAFADAHPHLTRFYADTDLQASARLRLSMLASRDAGN